MAKWIDIPKFTDMRGSLVVIQDILPFKIQRVYWMFDVVGVRGGHRHKSTIQGLVCVKGKCRVNINNGKTRSIWNLDSPNQLLLVDVADWHTMDEFSADAVLLVFASEKYDQSDYIDEDYSND